MLTHSEDGASLRGMHGNGRHEMDRVASVVVKGLAEVGKAAIDPVPRAYLRENSRVCIADRHSVDMGMREINGNEFSPETQAYDSNIDLAVAHCSSPSFTWTHSVFIHGALLTCCAPREQAGSRGPRSCSGGHHPYWGVHRLPIIQRTIYQVKDDKAI